MPRNPSINQTYGVSSLTGLMHSGASQITLTKVGVYYVSCVSDGFGSLFELDRDVFQNE